MFPAKTKQRSNGIKVLFDEDDYMKAMAVVKGGTKIEQLAGMWSTRLVGIVMVACTFSFMYFMFLFGSRGCGMLYPCRHRTGDSLLNSSYTHPIYEQAQALDAALQSEDALRASGFTFDSADDDDDTFRERTASFGRSKPPTADSFEDTRQGYETGLANIVFGIAASARLWEQRKEYVKLWWRPGEMRGFVWLDRPVKNWSTTLPPLKISGDTSKFNYTNKKGSRSAIRISRVVSETFRMGLPDVHWFVMGDDDTIFVPENLVKVLSKYDHRRYYYIGSPSESHTQNIHFSYNMAYGGGGFAISYPLAKALERSQDRCIQKYPYLYGSDDRMQACMAELGVPLTKEQGFHQFDVYGDAFGLLAAHPLTPFISIHHLDVIDPIFPNMTQVEALRHLKKSVRVDPGGILQQSICYDRWRRWSISVSWGYAVQVFRGLIPPRTLELPMRTFLSWYKKSDDMGFQFNTRTPSKNPCEQPSLFFMKDVGYREEDGQTMSTYVKETRQEGECKLKQQHSPAALDWISVVKEETDESWHLAPRRQCCRVMKTNKKYLEIRVENCENGETLI